MIYPIVAYGAPVLRKVCVDIKKGEFDVKKVSDDMFETMYSASGVGLAGPQVGLAYRIFVVDGEIMNKGAETEDEIDQSLIGFKKTFINAQILEEKGEKWAYEEGCLSIPGIRADVYRSDTLIIRYLDTDFVEYTEEYSGLAARIIQHEYDHIEGVLFTDHLAPLKKQMLKKRLGNIQKGIVDADYRMKFA
ncbi:peptide deformylase [Lacihabitans sp. CS3-21]|jgi:peptide deformylase|uniref:peptide deformylase n=1 Tax=Lacihabitans sp. CS3-21 TaxID=2487332 RepID=UPI0020CFCBB0|nr:peptide deformylase [Lacihabitans sp. CS3-21]MCP9746225.1 peptide deformylase [Lacihabitans sp. CS3-21]